MRGGLLNGPMRPLGVDELGRQSQSSPAAVGLGLFVDEPVPGDTVQTAPHGQRAVVQVNVRPALAECFRLLKSHGQRNGPSSGVAVGLSGRHHLDPSGILQYFVS